MLIFFYQNIILGKGHFFRVRRRQNKLKMCDIFMPEEFGDMFRNQHIIILGRQVDTGVDR